MLKKIISLVLKKVPRPVLQRISFIAIFFIKPFYWGKGTICPVCKSEYKHFLPYGRVSRANALCPSCLSLERHRMLWLYLQERTDFFTKPYKMLHIAPEACFIPRFKKLPNLHYTTADLVSPLADVKMDIQQMPFADNQFDVLFCNHVLEHVPDDRQAMREIFRVLKPGGWAVLQIPLFFPLPEHTDEDPTLIDPQERERRFGQDDHVRKYGWDYRDRLKNIGFIVPDLDYLSELDTATRQKYALPDEDYLFRVNKPA